MAYHLPAITVRLLCISAAIDVAAGGSRNVAAVAFAAPPLLASARGRQRRRSPSRGHLAVTMVAAKARIKQVELARKMREAKAQRGATGLSGDGASVPDDGEGRDGVAALAEKQRSELAELLAKNPPSPPSGQQQQRRELPITPTAKIRTPKAAEAEIAEALSGEKKKPFQKAKDRKNKRKASSIAEKNVAKKKRKLDISEFRKLSQSVDMV